MFDRDPIDTFDFGPVTLEELQLWRNRAGVSGIPEAVVDAMKRNLDDLNEASGASVSLRVSEFDEAGTMEIEFLAIKPGRYFLRIPGSSGESQRVEISIQ